MEISLQNGEGMNLVTVGIGILDFPLTLLLTQIITIMLLMLKHHLVKKFDRDRNFIRQWGKQGIGDGEFNLPEGIATFSGNSLLVVDSQNNRVQEFSRDGVFITKWGSQGTQPSQFSVPTGVAINKIDDMHYISDTGNHRVQRFHWDPAVPYDPNFSRSVK